MTTPPTAVPKLLFTTLEASQALGLCEKTIFNATKSGELRATKIGRAVRYTLADLQDFIARKQGEA